MYIVQYLSCKGLEPAIFRLRGKGVTITLARMDQFMYNLGLVLCDSTGATIRNKVQFLLTCVRVITSLSIKRLAS